MSELVTVSATSAATKKTEETKWTMPWWLILVIVLSVLATLGGGFWWFRRKEKKRRKAHTAKFANELGNKEVRLRFLVPSASLLSPQLLFSPPLPVTDLSLLRRSLSRTGHQKTRRPPPLHLPSLHPDRPTLTVLTVPPLASQRQPHILDPPDAPFRLLPPPTTPLTCAVEVVLRSERGRSAVEGEAVRPVEMELYEL